MTEKTVIGDGNYFMSGSIIHHDCEIEDNVVICSNVSIAGNVTIIKVQLGNECVYSSIPSCRLLYNDRNEQLHHKNQGLSQAKICRSPIKK